MDNQWLTLLNKAGIEPYNEILKSGMITDVIVNPTESYWLLKISLSSPLEAVDFLKFTSSFKKFLIAYSGVKDIGFEFSYREPQISDQLIESYFLLAIEIATRKALSCKVLEHYKKQYRNGQITIFVPSTDELAIIEKPIVEAKKIMTIFGFGFVTFDSEVSRFEKSVIDLTTEKIRVMEEYLDNNSLESQTKIIQTKEELKAKKQIKNTKKNNYLTLEINELPTLHAELAEFINIHGTDKVIVSGILIESILKKVKNFDLFEGVITNFRDSIKVKHFISKNRNGVDSLNFFKNEMNPDTKISVKGMITYDTFANDITIIASEITVLGKADYSMRSDLAEEKRIELHAHTQMSALDGVLNVEKYVEMAKHFGHKALAITDHANCHALPEFFNCCKKFGIKAIAGVEGYFVDDHRYNIALTDHNLDLKDATYVVFDLETTGFSARYHEIIEIGAVKIKNGITIDQFSTFVKPSRPISKLIYEITKISDQDVADAPNIEEVLPKFKEFIDGTILVAHNATFDTGILYENFRKLGYQVDQYPCIDTLQMAKALYSDILKQYNLKAVTKALKVELNQQHRALSDAQTTVNIFMKMLGDLFDRSVYNYQQINSVVDLIQAYKYIIPTHINILVRNKAGLKNFYKLISDSHTDHFHREARILKSVLDQLRDNLLVGSGCCNGEVFKTAFEKGQEELEKVMAYYDYIEVQPLECYDHLVESSGEEITRKFIKETIINIIQTAKRLGKLVIATGDVHELDEADRSYRSIYLKVARTGGGLHELFKASEAPKMYFRTTQEMLNAFSFLDQDLAYEIVITNPNKINDLIDQYELFDKKLHAPLDDFLADRGVPSMSKAIKEIAFANAYQKYGNPLPEYVEKRLSQELDGIIGNGFSSVYYISYLLVKNSNENGYVVGSRGSVGSSFAATMLNITEVNPLVPHYRCPNCHFTAFKNDEQQLPKELADNFENVFAGQDLNPADCPKCGSRLIGDGVDIPFETFLGFKGDKVPDIDLNFSGEYQERAHRFCVELFGVDHSFRAGTVSTVAEKNAFGYVKNYLEERNKYLRKAEVNRIAKGLVGTKKTTGQHPGGIVVIPNYMEFTDIIPVQYPADSLDAPIRTIHYDYHQFERNLLKLDVLGHDDPTMIRFLMDFVEKYPEKFPFKKFEEIPISDPLVISLFKNRDALNLQGSDLDELDPYSSGTLGIPELGTPFVRGMLHEVKPATFDEIVKISGLSHGTDVWLGNARNLFLGLGEDVNERIPFSKLICCRDDIMLDLIKYGIAPFQAFTIMESVRKGKGLTEDQKTLLRQHQVPEWYIDSCIKIKYMFPKAHAAAYVIMALRIAWFKVYHPLYYYSAYFSCRASAFNVEVMALGRNALRNLIINFKDAKDNKSELSNKEENLNDDMKIALEMTLRGYHFEMVDIIESDATVFKVNQDESGLYIPFIAVDKLGGAAANSVIEARQKSPFRSVKDVANRTKLNKTTFNQLLILGAFKKLPDE